MDRLKNYTREFRLIKSTLNLGLKKDVSETKTGKLLKSKGFLSTKGKTNTKGKKALEFL